MTLVRLKCLVSFLIALLIAFSAGIATYAQATSDLEPHRTTKIPGGEPTRTAMREGMSDPIDTVNSRIRSEDGERVWQMTGPFGGDVTALAIDPRDPNRILLGTSDGQIFRSVDGGVIWKRIRPGIKATGFAVTVILFDREKPNAILAGIKAVTPLGEETKGGSLFISEDGGENWREFEGMHGRAIRGVVQSAKDSNVFAAATLDGIYRTMDRGQTWERITPANDPELRGFHSVALDPRDVDIIYVGTNHLPWKTMDGGKTWKLAGNNKNGVIEDSDIFTIHIDQTNPDTVLMSACSGIYRSLDASANWAKIQGIPYTSRRTHVIYQHPTKPEVIFAGTTEGLWLSTNGGKPDSWRRVTSLRLVINAVAIHPDRPDRIFLGTEDNGVLISNDGGESYESSNAGFINRQVRAVLADQKERGRIYSGVIFDGANSGLFVSEDGGLSWQQSVNGMGVRDVYSLYQSSTTPETIYAGTNHGLFRSDDHGRNWAAVKKEEAKDETEAEMKGKLDGNGHNDQNHSQQPESQSGPNRGRPRRVKATEGARVVKPIVQNRAKTQAKNGAGKGNKQARAKTRKSSVAQKPKPQPSDLVDLQNQVFALIPFTPRRESKTAEPSEPVTTGPPAGTSGVPEASAGAAAGASTEVSTGEPAKAPANWLIASTWDGLFRTEDEKKGWKAIKLRPSSEGVEMRQPRINAIASSPHAPGVIFVGTEEGLFVSRDNGETFTLTRLEDEPRRIRCIAFDPRTAETIYVGTSTGFFRSMDGGKTWENRGGGMPLLSDIGAIVINSLNPDELYAGDDLRGKFHFSKDQGKNWEQLDISQLPSARIWSLASDPFDQNKLYAGSFSGGVYIMSRR